MVFLRSFRSGKAAVAAGKIGSGCVLACVVGTRNLLHRTSVFFSAISISNAMVTLSKMP